MEQNGVQRSTRGDANSSACAVVFALVIALALPSLTRSQTPIPATPKFDVASIKPCGGSGPGFPGVTARRGRLLVTCEPVRTLIRDAYLLMADLNSRPVFGFDPIAGGPDWTKSERYMIEAKTEGNPTIQMMEGPMLQALLEDRFKLKVHRETKEIPVYELMVAKGGFKAPPLGANCVPNAYDPAKAPPDPNAIPPIVDPVADTFKRCDTNVYSRQPGPEGPHTGKLGYGNSRDSGLFRAETLGINGSDSCQQVRNQRGIRFQLFVRARLQHPRVTTRGLFSKHARGANTPAR